MRDCTPESPFPLPKPPTCEPLTCENKGGGASERAREKARSQIGQTLRSYSRFAAALWRFRLLCEMRRVSTLVMLLVRTGFLLFLDDERGSAHMDFLVGVSMPSSGSDRMSSVIDASSPHSSSLYDCCRTRE